MGPPQAREVLVDCLSRVPGEAILLTDSAFAGADTGATAYSLACAIRRIEREMFGGSRDYAIVTGMQSVDGDTAQVPPQIAEELGIDHIAYAKGLETEPRARGPPDRRRGRSRTSSPLRWPVLVTVTACTDPLYRSFERTREARQRRDPRVEREVGRRRPDADRPQGLVDPGLPALLAVARTGPRPASTSGTRPS